VKNSFLLYQTLKTHTVLNYQEVKALHKQRVLSSPHGSCKKKRQFKRRDQSLMVQTFTTPMDFMTGLTGLNVSMLGTTFSWQTTVC
jgi:hypothetical protein